MLERFIERIFGFFTANVGTKLISVVIAVVLWIIVLGSRNVEVTKEIPLHVVTAPEVVVANEIPDRIVFRLTGPKAFLRAVLDRRDDPIQVNLVAAKPGVVTYRFFNDNIRVPIGVRVMGINPPSILIKLEPVKRRDVVVRPITGGQVPDGFRVDRVEAKPATVRIKGAESHVSSLSEVQTLPIDITGLRQTSEREAAFDLTRYGVQLDGPLPKVTIHIDSLEANYRIKNVDVRVLTSAGLHPRIDEKTVSVLVRTDSEKIKAIDKSQISAIVDLTGKPRGRYDRQSIRVSLPQDVGLVKVVPDHVNVTLY